MTDGGLIVKKKLAVLFGGQSTEHEVSRVSAASILKNIDKSLYEVYPIGITKTGEWFLYSGSIDKMETGEWEHDDIKLQNGAQKILFNKEVDVVFPVIHGAYGEDGSIQGLCKFLNLPYVGPGVLSSAICMDKVYTKYVLDKFNIKQAKYIAIEYLDFEKENSMIISNIEEKIGYPSFIKPSNSGSSVGISKAHNREELIEGIKTAFRYDKRLLVEEAINAREIEVAVLGNDCPKAAIPGEIIPSKEFYDYEAKYKSDDSVLVIPAKLTNEKLEAIRNNALKVYKALDCSGMARVDFLVDKETLEVYLNEVNTIPGFTSISMYPKMWENSGINYTELINELIKLAIERGM